MQVACLMDQTIRFFSAYASCRCARTRCLAILANTAHLGNVISRIQQPARQKVTPRGYGSLPAVSGEYLFTATQPLESIRQATRRKLPIFATLSAEEIGLLSCFDWARQSGRLLPRQVGNSLTCILPNAVTSVFQQRQSVFVCS